MQRLEPINIILNGHRFTSIDNQVFARYLFEMANYKPVEDYELYDPIENESFKMHNRVNLVKDRKYLILLHGPTKAA